MTEGRGPMVLDALYVDREKAVGYANSKLGVMGRKPFAFHKTTSTCDCCGQAVDKCRGWDCRVCWKYGGDWQIKELLLNE